MDMEPKFWNQVDSSDPLGCWPWQGKTHRGYGYIWLRGCTWSSNRLAWTLTFGTIPSGQVVRHRCDNRGCCNPSHLELGTQADNVMDRVVRGRSASKRGELNGRAKVTTQQVEEIRALRGIVQQKELAARYGITQASVSRIQLHQGWTE